MANVCERCKRSMSSHDDHASCPQCRMAAGECSLDLENPCNFCGEWTSKQWGKLRRSLVDARARASQRGRQHWSAAFPRLEAWILSKLVYTPLSQKSLPRMVKVISRIIYWSALQTSKLSRVWWCKLKMGSTWRLVRPLRHPVRPLRHPVWHPCS